MSSDKGKLMRNQQTNYPHGNTNEIISMKTKYTNIAALTCASLLGSAALSQAALTVGGIISVNFANSATGGPDYGATMSGAAVVGSAGDTWNNITGTGGFAPLSSTLNLTDGFSSGVGLNIGTGTYNSSDSTGTTLDVFKGNIYLAGTGTNTAISLTGFSAGQLVDLYLYAAAGHTAGEGATFDFGSIKTTTDSAVQETAYVEGSNYVKYASLAADGTGTINGTWTVGANYSSFAGFQVVAVPEPSAALLGGLGMLCLLRRRRA